MWLCLLPARTYLSCRAAFGGPRAESQGIQEACFAPGEASAEAGCTLDRAGCVEETCSRPQGSQDRHGEDQGKVGDKVETQVDGEVGGKAETPGQGKAGRPGQIDSDR